MRVNALIKVLGEAAGKAIANRSAPEEVRVLVDVINGAEVEPLLPPDDSFIDQLIETATGFPVSTDPRRAEPVAEQRRRMRAVVERVLKMEGA